MLNRYELLVAKEESERVDTLRYSWQKLQSLAVNICNLCCVCCTCLIACISRGLQQCFFFFFFSGVFSILFLFKNCKYLPFLESKMLV